MEIKGDPSKLRDAEKLGEPATVPIFADDQELKDMAVCSPKCIAIIKQQLDKLNGHCRGTALDVAGGDGRVALNLLIDEYESVDLFDRCPEAINRAT